MRLREKQAELQIRVGSNPYNYKGTGLSFRGHKVLSKADESRGIAVMTRWIELGSMPLIPIGSYRVIQPTDNGGSLKVVGKVKLQWDQVLNGWKRAAIVALLYVALILAFVLWDKLRR